MSILQVCERLQDAWISRSISESTWGYPIVGAIHVLAFALAGGAIFVPRLSDEARWVRQSGLSLVVITGLLLFAARAVGYSGSTSFHVKIVLLGILALEGTFFRQRSGRLRWAIVLALWVAVIFVSRGIAFF